MRKTFFFLFSSLSLFSFSIYAQNTIKLDRKISVVGSGTVTAFPDAAQITISFLHIKPTLREAINENQLTSEQVLKIVKKYVSDSTEIQTSLISTDKSYKWDQKLSKEVFVGFQSSQKLIFTLERDLKKNQIKSSGKKINYDIMLGSTKEMVDLYKNIGRFSLSNETVFINGENGTGKELLAKILHEFNKKEIGEFLVIHGNINELADKVIFGEEIYDGNKLLEVKQSSLEKASNGTILIKEVENLSLETQIKLLEFIETGNFVRINGKEKVNSKTRIICSSSKNLEEMVEENRFYEGLWDKIEKNTLYIPPLREKKDDLPELIEYFIDIFNDELKLNIKGVDKLALNKIMKYNFPNNIKELKSVIKASMALARNEYIIVEDLPAQVIGTKISKRYGAVHDWVLADWIEGELDMLEKTNEGEYYDSLISRVERELIRQVLERTKGKKVEAAELLGITRTTLRTKMNSYGLD